MPLPDAPKATIDESFAPSSPWRSFFISVGLVLLLASAALFTGAAIAGQSAIEDQLQTRARSIFNSIVLARSWNALHGGVFVEKRPGMEASPFLPNSELVTDGGTVYVQKNHAVMAREISELASSQGVFRFHLTSLQPLNPANTPDRFEADALNRFAAGAREHTAREQSSGSTWFRYMAPLRAEASCVACHADQEVGAVRGGMSVKFNIDEAERAITRSRWIIGALWFVTFATLVGVLWWLLAVLYRRLRAAELRILEMARTDELTGLYNRRFVVERLAEELARATRFDRPLSCILFDIDHFKRVNDTHGHDGGDAVLKAVSSTVRAELRHCDVVARYGGEEFLVLLPETRKEEAREVALRLRRVVSMIGVLHDGKRIRVTASFGLASASTSERGGTLEPEALVKAADQALYAAKESGRDRVECAA